MLQQKACSLCSTNTNIVLRIQSMRRIFVYFNSFSTNQLSLTNHESSTTNFFCYYKTPPQAITMCYQVIQLYECGHHSASIDVPCSQPSKDCGGVFLRQEIEDTKGPCEVNSIRRGDLSWFNIILEMPNGDRYENPGDGARR